MPLHCQSFWRAALTCFVSTLSLPDALPILVVVLPWLATAGDSLAHRLRSQHGVAAGWAETRMGPGALAPVRFLRNVVLSVRSEEHTSELQSRPHLVCRLMLEKQNIVKPFAF